MNSRCKGRISTPIISVYLSRSWICEWSWCHSFKHNSKDPSRSITYFQTTLGRTSAPPCQSTSSHPRFQLPANKWATGSNSIWHISNVRKMNENRILQVVGEKRWDMHSTTFLFLASNASASLRCFVLLNDLYWANHDQWVTHDPSRNCTSRQRP